ncbi:KilA-N domain-containing protein [Pseudomonas aeruginosa]|uniref:KilA-N domain-containing protein n=1 Tax=Pseudomonas aeruginosa TaxID=287 RepID=UPI0028FE3867|nr:KilA-N domain-containing protein [Pseudomonas aeruginosa]MDU0701892.1 KilA-N domain-containing protein [Pseudomonas aeruginosa]
MKMCKIVMHSYAGNGIGFDTIGWMNATHAGSCFQKDPEEWIGLDLTRLYISGLSKKTGVTLDSLVIKRRGNEKSRGMWLHPKLALRFSRWLSIDFEIWFEDQLDLRESTSALAVKAARRQAAMSYRSLCEALVITHQEIGKETKPHHYMNEARLINEILTGVFRGRDRSQLTLTELELVTLLENRDVLLLGQGKDYNNRKIALTQYLVQLCASGYVLSERYG